jgi:3-mercaptopyruvate sulfurtransferase SseA
MTTRDQNRDTFLQWIAEHPETDRPQDAASPRTIKTKQQRDRLIRMETMLEELITLKQIIVDGRNFYAEKI